VHLIFQPGEEGGAGAKAMMDDGLFTLFPCDAVFALHNWPSPPGQMAVRVGPIMASTCVSDRVKGKGGHAAMPHKTLDPIPWPAHRRPAADPGVAQRGPRDSAVLTVGKITAARWRTSSR
jgi:hippurate hydrolase